MAKDCLLAGKTVHYKHLALHPGCYDNSFPYIIAVSKDDKVTIRKFQLVDGYSCPIVLDEEKPGLRGFDCIWTKDGTVVTYQVKRVRDASPAKSVGQSKDLRMVTRDRPVRARPDVEILGSEMDDFEYDDGSSVAMFHNVRYCISKEEYPPELLRTFDIV